MTKIVGAAEFKAKCLKLIDEMAADGVPVTITKRGRPLATVGPAHMPAWKSPEGAWAGRVTIAGDLMETDTSGLWEALRPRRGKEF